MSSVQRQWAESPNTMGRIAHFLDHPLALVPVVPRASLEGMPHEIILRIVSFLRPGSKTHPKRGRWGFERVSVDVVKLSSTCSALYRIFRPLRFRSLSLGGDQKSLNFVRLLLEDVGAQRLIRELTIDSVCPLHGQLDQPYAELMAKALNLESFWFDANHPLPAPFGQALRRLKDLKLEAVQVSEAGLESVTELAKTRSWKKGGALEGLKKISLGQANYTIPSIDGRACPPWLFDQPVTRWEECEHALLHDVSSFLAHSAATLEELSLLFDLRFNSVEYGNDLPLRTMLSDPAQPVKSPLHLSGPQQAYGRRATRKGVGLDKGGRCDIHSIKTSPVDHPTDHSHLLQFPRLRRLVLPRTDLREDTVRRLVASSPDLEGLHVTHSPIVLVDAASALLGILNPIDRDGGTIDFGGGLRHLRTLVYSEERTTAATALAGIDRAEATPSFVQMVNCVRGVGLTSLTLGGLLRVTADHLLGVAEACGGLEVLFVSSVAWEGDVSAIRSSLASLSQLVSLSFDYPTEQTDPPDEPPPIQSLVIDPDDDRLSAADMIDEIHEYFYDGAEGPEDDDDESETDELDDGTSSSSASWKTVLETSDDADAYADDWHSARGSIAGEAVEGDALARVRAAVGLGTKDAVDPTLIPLPASVPGTPLILDLAATTFEAEAINPVSTSPSNWSSPSATSSFVRSQSPSLSTASSSSEPDQAVYAGRYQNDNLFHFSAFAHAFAVQHPKLETFEWTFDGWLEVEWKVQRDKPDPGDQGKDSGPKGRKDREKKAEGDKQRVSVLEHVWYPRLMELYLLEEDGRVW